MANNFIIGLLSIVVFVFISNMFFEFRKNYLKLFLLCFFSILGKIVLPIRNNPQLNLLYSIFVFMALMYLFFKGTIFYKIVFVCIYIIGSAVTELFTMKILSMIFKSFVLTDSVAYILGIFSSNLLLVYIAYLISTYKVFDKNEMTKYSWIILILPITSILLILGIDDYYIFTESNSLIFIVVGLLLSNYISVFIHYKTVREFMDKNKLAEELKETIDRNEYLTKLLQQHNVFLHSIRKQSKDMLALLESENYIDLEKYIKDVYSDTTVIYNMINSNYEIVDIIINDRLYIIKNNNIILRIKLECTNFFPLDYVNIESMFNLIIDLALSESLKLKKDPKTLIIKSKKIGEQNILTICFSSTIQVEFNPIFSSLISLIDKFHLEYLIDNFPEKKQTYISILFISKR